MYGVILSIHIVISIFLIAVILLQAGRGGGLSDTFGSSQLEYMFGTRSATILTKITAVCAIGFIVTCLSLAIISSHKSRTLLDRVPISQKRPSVSPIVPQKGEERGDVSKEASGETNLPSQTSEDTNR